VSEKVDKSVYETDLVIELKEQRYFEIEQKETTLLSGGIDNSISSLKINFNGACITLHHHPKLDKPIVSIHEAQKMELAIFNKITKKLTVYDDDLCWTDIKVVE